ncbi:hypothetical protein DFO58_1325 [Arthrobacter sp. AG1021]|uniref:hypothetical protein n=1 Tax=Arthrobacter sp. AG1021 TaxID=2183908 RepID=UPI000F1759D4|nr:hypothetical protein [Arthrobacter sp. AG1021]RKS20788.1 hypothetical protein DFO58_1325 [Arthrobacter sp. AG1021]
MHTSIFIISQSLRAQTSPQVSNNAFLVILGGVIGAILTGVVNLIIGHLNHKRQVRRDTTAASQQMLMARLSAQAQEKREQQNWLRNEKLSLYNKFAQNAQELMGDALDTNLPNLTKRSDRLQAMKNVSIYSLKLVASESVNQKAGTFYQSLYNHLIPIPEDKIERAIYSSRRKTADSLTKSLRELLNEMREDLGSPRISQDFKWVIDDEHDKSN